MSVTIRLRKTDFTTPAFCNTLALQRIHGSSCRAYWLKQALVAAGWTVYYSSTGTTTGSSDLWTSSAFQAILMQTMSATASALGTVDGVWSCLRSPDVDANGDYLHICLSPSQSQWYNPAVRGPTNGMNLYGVPVKNASTWTSGEYNGFLRLGMALSSSSTAFSGGAPYVSTDTATARGTLPSATDAFWTTHNLGQGGTTANTQVKCLTVLTEGNQFHVLQEQGTTFTAGYRNWWSLCSMVDGGYAVVEQGVQISASTTGTHTGQELVGGRQWTNTSGSTAANDIPTELGGWRSGYIKRVGGVIISGGLACPEPVGWEALADTPTFEAVRQYPYTAYLQAVSCSDTSHYNLGAISDFVLIGNTRIADLDLVRRPTSSSSVWYALRDYKANLLKWDLQDDPSLRNTVTP